MFYHRDDAEKKLCEECKHCQTAEGGFECALFRNGYDSRKAFTSLARTAGMQMCGDEGKFWERKTNS